MKLIIEPKGEKSRAFSAEMVASATADPLWNHTDTRNTRPLWAVFAGPTEALRAFTENLRLGHVATDGKDRGGLRVEFQKSVPFRWWTRALPAGGSCTVVAHPSLLSWRSPVEDEYRYRFLVLPALSWLAAQTFDEERATATLRALIASSAADNIATEYDQYSHRTWQMTYKSKIQPEVRYADRLLSETLHDLLGYGALLLHYLDHRLPLPMPRDPVFGAWLLLVGHHGGGIVRIHSRLSEYRERSAYSVQTPEAAGCAPGFYFNGGAATPRHLEQIQVWLAREVRRWVRVNGGV